MAHVLSKLLAFMTGAREKLGNWLIATVLGCLGACAPSSPALMPAPKKSPAPVLSAAPEIKPEIKPELNPEIQAAEPVDVQPMPENKAEGPGEIAERVLFLATHLRTDELRKVCPKSLEDGPRVKCLIAMRYEDERESQKLALELYEQTGSISGLLPEESTDDGRGNSIRLLPARPIGKNRIHLEWIGAAFRDYSQFKNGLSEKAPITFRDRPIYFRFYYSEKGGMPSAFAVKNNIGYNLFGTVNVSEEAVRETLFHEIFHINDGERGAWSEKNLGELYAGILSRCGKNTACLAPFAPTDTKMNGLFYAFAPRSGVREYAAELALRYYREQRLMILKEPLPVPPFKCGPPENAKAMKALSDAFFGAVDLVPPCSKP